MYDAIVFKISSMITFVTGRKLILYITMVVTFDGFFVVLNFKA